jgi:ferredoxin
MKLILDTDRCQGHGRCYGIAPELFDADDQGHSVLLRPDVPANCETAAKHAVASCPEEAIVFGE